MKKNYYDILGLSKSATEADIKKAFKKLSLKYHPDRHANDSEEEKKNSEDKFKEINEAYSVLSDKEKRNYYDTYGSTEGYGSGGFSGPSAEDFFNMFNNNPFGGFGANFRHEQRVERGSNIQMEVPYTIEDFYCGTKKTLKYRKKFRCPSCHGAGGTGESVCPECNGTGFTQKVYRQGFSQTIVSEPCKKCGGKGKIYQYECHRCHGAGFEEREVTLDVNIPAGIIPGNGTIIQGAGNESSDPRGENGAFIIVPVFKYDRNRYSLDGYTIKEYVTVPYYDALLGCTITIELPDKTKKTITLSECTPDKKLYKLTNCGVHINGSEAGDYIVEIRYEYPKSLGSEEKSLLKKIKKLKNS